MFREMALGTNLYVVFDNTGGMFDWNDIVYN